MAKVVKFLKGKPHFEALFVFDRATNGEVVAATPTKVTVADEFGHTIVFYGSFTVAGLAGSGGVLEIEFDDVESADDGRVILALSRDELMPAVETT